MAKIIKKADAFADQYSLFERTVLEGFQTDTEIEEDIPDEPVQDPREALEEECQRILEETRIEAETKVREAYEEGLRRGEEAGRKAFLESVAQAAGVFHAVGVDIQQTRQTFLTELEDYLVDMNHAILARILRREAHTDPEMVRRVLREVMQTLSGQERVKIRMNPGDFDALNREAIGYLDEFDEIPRKEIVPDPEVESGGCIVESEALHVDASLQAQLNRILEAIEQPLADEPGVSGGDPSEPPA